MKNLLVLTLMMAIAPLVYSQKTVNVRDIIYNQFVKNQERDLFVSHREKLPFQKDFAVNNPDTVEVHEVVGGICRGLESEF